MSQTAEESFQTFKLQVQTLCLASLTNDGKPRSSVAPFIQDEAGNFYIYISQLAGHTQDLISNPQVSILLVEDEQNTAQIYARQRIQYDCDVYLIATDDEHYSSILDKMEKRFGNVVELLRTLPDFILFKLAPYKGQYVVGFGKAYKLTGEHLDQLEHIES